MLVFTICVCSLLGKNMNYLTQYSLLNYCFSFQNIYKSRTIKNLEFHELSFYHTRICNATFINSVINILLSKRCRSLKKLCLTFCVLQGNIEIRLINRLIYRKFKILEENVEQKEKQNVFRHVINNCRYLTDLEIVSCLK